MFLIEVGF